MSHPAPPRLNRLSPLSFAITVAVLAVLLASMTQVAPSPGQLVQGGPRFLNLMDRMTPPNLDPAFLWRIGARIVETFQIALVGAAFGVLLSIPIGWLAARGVSPLGRFHVVAKALVSLFRTIPDLVWALIFVATVGLGPVAGTLTIAMDTIGLCGRFFA
jgi:phosphonate transport system permease protein